MRTADRPWYCVRQRAGPLVKECRALRPRFSGRDTAADRREKRAVKQPPHSAVCRSQADRLELRLALFGFEGSHHTLTFDNAHLPADFAGVRASLRAFLARARRWHGGEPFDYIYCVEGLHGDHRYHIHTVLRDSDFPPAVVRHLWRGGEAWDEPVLMDQGGYRRLAEYLTKEPREVGRPEPGVRSWSAALGLTKPRTESESVPDTVTIAAPPGAIILDRREEHNEWGDYLYLKYLMPDRKEEKKGARPPRRKADNRTALASCSGLKHSVSSGRPRRKGG